jgi:copper chaperone
MTTTFQAPDIECDGCANAIKRALSKVEGISAVTVEVDKKTVNVTHSTRPETILAALDRAGFPATTA